MDTNNQTQESAQILNKKKAAEFCQISMVTLNRWIKERKISFLKVNGRVLFLKSELVKDLERFKVPAEN